MKLLKPLLVVLLVFLIVIQFFPTYKNKSNRIPTTDLILSQQSPSAVSTVLHNACYDCHSNNTDYPWYNHVQPVAWFLEADIQKGKHALNFNTFGKYSARQQKKKLHEIIRSLKTKTMPPTSYKIFHEEGRLNKKERRQIINWIETMLKT